MCADLKRAQSVAAPSKRVFLKKTATSFAAACVASRAPLVYAKKKYKLRIIGTFAVLQEEIRQQAMADLGIEIIHEPAGNAVIMHRAATRPGSFDIYEDSTDGVRILWQAGSIQPIEISRLNYWDSINSLTKTGKLTPDASYGAGEPPYKLLWVQGDRVLSADPSTEVSFLPTFHNVDSFGYNARVISEGESYKTESWAWLLDDQYAGKVATINSPTIGIFDLAMAVQAKGLMEFQNIGNMTRQDLDKLFNILIDYKKRGHFRGVWTSVPQSIEFMKNDEVVLQSMFSPAAAALQGEGIPCIYAAPKEGYRAWHGGISLSAATQGENKDAAYAYMDWWLSGWVGAHIARQGFYVSNPQQSKAFLSKNEWSYWYMGGPAETDLKNNRGLISVKKGSTRKGGSYEERFRHINVWNTAMDSYEYSLSKWQEFLLA